MSAASGYSLTNSGSSQDFWAKITQGLLYIDAGTRSHQDHDHAAQVSLCSEDALELRTSASVVLLESDITGALGSHCGATGCGIESGGGCGGLSSGFYIGGNCGGLGRSRLLRQSTAYRHVPYRQPTGPTKASSWDESHSVQRRRSLAALPTLQSAVTQPQLPPTTCAPIGSSAVPPPVSEPGVARDLRYYFQHPYARLAVTYAVTICNLWIFAEDPIAHSRAEASVPVLGNVFSFVATKYPREWRWKLIKVLMWSLAILCGMVFGKVLIHGYALGRLMRLKMFRDDQGSWMVMFLTVLVSLFAFSHVYNVLLALWHVDFCHLSINSEMDISNGSVMKAAACGTWLGDLVTALMVTDMMLQDNLYPHWAVGARRVWRSSFLLRLIVFWLASLLATGIVVTLIVSDAFSWDNINRDIVVTTELSRAFLASFILVMDLLIVMQDWDFPHFTTTLHINLPGLRVAHLQWKYAEVDISGKWFNYGIIIVVMLLDLNMWKNQIFYQPPDFGQYTDPDGRIHTVVDPEVLGTENASNWSWEARKQINPDTGTPYYEGELF